MEYYSFDIFDTCLVRSCGRAASVFDILATRILGKDADIAWIADFAKERIEGEKIARLNRGDNKEDVTIEQIYNYCDFSRYTSLPNAAILKEEINIEGACLQPVFWVKQHIESIRLGGGGKIIFISDMYLDSSFLKKILSRFDIFRDGDSIYVSCEVGLTKSSGHLYEYVAKTENITKNQFKHWIHMGDNVHSDYNIPKSLGLNAERCLHGYNYYQNERCEMEHTSGVFDSYYCASFSRSIILKYAPNPAVSFASDFIAPIYVPFVYSIFLDAEKRGIKSLYFCARDGLILYNIAKEIQHFFSNIDIHYLYVSRASLYFPGLPDVSFDTLKSLLNTTPSFSLDVFLELLNMEDYSYDKSEIDKFSVREDVLSYLYHQQEFKSLLQKRHKEHRMLCLEYFKQEGMLEKPCAIVDLTGTRRCQNAMNNILHSCGSSVFGYYFEVLNHRYNGMDYMAEYFADRYTWNIHNCRIEPHDIFEQYFSISNHNRTVSYRKAEGRIEPVFSQDSAASEYKERVFEINNRVCRDYASLYGMFVNGKKCHEHIQQAVAVYSRFSFAPDKWHLTALDGLTVSQSSHQRPKNVIEHRNFFSCIKHRSHDYWFMANAVYNSHFSSLLTTVLRLYYAYRKLNKNRL